MYLASLPTLNLNTRLLTATALIGAILAGTNTAHAATPAQFWEQSYLSGSADTLKATRVPVRSSTGAINYYNIDMKFQLDATGKPVLAPLNPVTSVSPVLRTGLFKTDNYKDGDGNVYLLSGQGAAAGGRTSWSLNLIKPVSTTNPASLNSSWLTGPIAGHYLEPTLTARGIKTNAFSWGGISGNGTSFESAWDCDGDPVGFVQSGDQVVLDGYCSGTSAITSVMVLDKCTAANPCP